MVCPVLLLHFFFFFFLFSFFFFSSAYTPIGYSLECQSERSQREGDTGDALGTYISVYIVIGWWVGECVGWCV